ncbi:hypothetical protein KAT73_03135 [candidate division WOR-3 bacterium]|nr:hypothetical protein [candidate division WOR-3 bacterium]
MRLPRPSSDGLAMTDSRMRLQQCITSQSPNGDACPAKAGHSKKNSRKRMRLPRSFHSLAMINTNLCHCE